MRDNKPYFKNPDITGQLFNKWTVTSYYENGLWNCKCECGNDSKVAYSSLTKGNSKGCSECSNMPKTNLSGSKVNKWTVLEYSGQGRWLCQCECKRTSKVSTKELLEGQSKGCKPCALRLPEGEASFNDVYDTYKCNAKKGKRDFLLTKIEARELFEGNCLYCGQCPSTLRISKKGYKSGFLYNGIDRVVNEVGYVIGNCVSCCSICNHMKHVLSEKVFLEHISKIYKHGVDRCPTN